MQLGDGIAAAESALPFSLVRQHGTAPQRTAFLMGIMPSRSTSLATATSCVRFFGRFQSGVGPGAGPQSTANRRRTAMSLQAKLDAFKADFEAGKPPYNVSRSVIETMHRATAELIASGAARRAKKAGEIAPSFSLQDPAGNGVNSYQLLKRGPLVVSFYRGVWCPYCIMELQALEAVKSEFDKYGASLVAISPQTAPNSRNSVRQNKLSFPILSDVQGKAGAAFALRFNLQDYLIQLYNVLNTDLST